jgi:hypothetical protein
LTSLNILSNWPDPFPKDNFFNNFKPPAGID